MHPVLSAARQNDPNFKNQFETLNWLPLKDRFNQSINSIVFKYFTKQCPSYLNEAFETNLRTKQFKNKK